MGKLTALAGAETSRSRPTSRLGWRLLLQKVEQWPRIFLLLYMYIITLQKILFQNTHKFSFRMTQYCSHVTR